MRSIFAHALGTIAMLAGAAPALADAWPERAIRLIVPYPAGGSTDILARALQQPMADSLGKPIIIENKPGAGGGLGSEYVARSAPDGYTIVFGNLGPNAINASIYKNLRYDPVKDFAPVSVAASIPLILVAHPKFPARSVGELIAYAKARPGQIMFASVGAGSASHVTGEMFNMMTGVKLVHVPYRGGAPAVADVVAGHVPLMFATGLEAAEHIRDGRLIALGVAPKQRTALLPDAPAIAETAPGFDVSVWFGVLAPAQTPTDIIDRLNRAVRHAVDDPQVQAKLQSLGAEPMPTTPAEFARIIVDDVAKWAEVVRKTGVSVE